MGFQGTLGKGQSLLSFLCSLLHPLPAPERAFHAAAQMVTRRWGEDGAWTGGMERGRPPRAGPPWGRLPPSGLGAAFSELLRGVLVWPWALSSRGKVKDHHPFLTPAPPFSQHPPPSSTSPQGISHLEREPHPKGPREAAWVGWKVPGAGEKDPHLSLAPAAGQLGTGGHGSL